MSGIGVGVEEADGDALDARCRHVLQDRPRAGFIQRFEHLAGGADALPNCLTQRPRNQWWRRTPVDIVDMRLARSEEHTSELQSLMRISYAVFCLKKIIFNLPTTKTRKTIPNLHSHLFRLVDILPFKILRLYPEPPHSCTQTPIP